MFFWGVKENVSFNQVVPAGLDLTKFPVETTLHEMHGDDFAKNHSKIKCSCIKFDAKCNDPCETKAKSVGQKNHLPTPLMFDSFSG